METSEQRHARIYEKFWKAYGFVSEADIRRMAAINPPINNVLTGLSDESFGLIPTKNEFSPQYILTYINGVRDLRCEAISLSIDDGYCFELTMAFCMQLLEEFPSLDPIDCFNTYSWHLRQYLEVYGFTTFASNELEGYNDHHITIITKGKPAVHVPVINKLGYYRDFFDNNYKRLKESDEPVVYLLFDSINKLFKIGRSINMAYRERTLQSQMPKVETIAFWQAPVEIEKQLHQRFGDKRQRGEWFKLGFQDLKVIKEMMSTFIL